MVLKTPVLGGACLGQPLVVLREVDAVVCTLEARQVVGHLDHPSRPLVVDGDEHDRRVRAWDRSGFFSLRQLILMRIF